MAEVAELEEIIEGAERAAKEAEEGIEELSEEAQEEIEAEIAETHTAIEELSTIKSKFANFLKFLKLSCVVDVAKFTGKNIAIGAIMWGVNVALNKLLPHEQKETKTRMRKVIKALSDVINTEAKINQKALEWMTTHKDDTITLDGFEVPLEAVLTKYIKPLVKATEQAEIIATSLQEKVDGKVQFKCPTADDMRKFMDISEVFIKAFTNLITFILKHKDQVKELLSFPVKQADIIDLEAKLNIAKALPLW